MSALTINGIEAPVAVDSIRETEIEIAERGRALSGAALGTRLESGIKRAWSGRLITSAQLDAWAFRGMLNGGGYGFSFASNLRDDWKGNQGWSTTHAAREAGGKFSAGQMSVSAANSTTFTFPTWWPTNRWSCSLYRLNGAAWEHWVFVYGAETLWKNGVSGFGASWFYYDSVQIILSGDAGAAAKYSEIVIHPFKWPTTWPALVCERTTAMVKPPYIGLGGALTGRGETPPASTEIACQGSAISVNPRNRGTLEPLQEIDFSVEEK